jgi:hypothetical protein
MMYLLSILAVVILFFMLFVVRKDEKLDTDCGCESEEVEPSHLDAERPFVGEPIEQSANLDSKAKIMNHLKTYGTIDKTQAKLLYGINNLPQVVHRLRLKGKKIDTIMEDKVFINYKLRYWRNK